MSLVELFLSFFKIGLFSFGGGMASLSLIQQEIVLTKGYLELSAFIDLITIAEMTPGPIAVNAATFVGLQLAGFKGAVVATLGCISPSLIIVSSLAFVYYKFKELTLIQQILVSLRPAIVGLILSAGVSIFMLSVFGEDLSFDMDYLALFIFCLALFGLQKYELNPIWVMVCSGLVGLLYI